MATKKELALDLYKNLQNHNKLTRAEFIRVAQLPPLDMTPAGAATYYANCKNAIEGGGTSTPKAPKAPKAKGAPASTNKKVDDSKENQELYSIVLVDGIDKSKAVVGEITQVHAFFTQTSATDRFEQLNAKNKARAVVVKGSPEVGSDIKACTVIKA